MPAAYHGWLTGEVEPPPALVPSLSDQSRSSEMPSHTVAPPRPAHEDCLRRDEVESPPGPLPWPHLPAPRAAAGGGRTRPGYPAGWALPPAPPVLLAIDPGPQKPLPVPARPPAAALEYLRAGSFRRHLRQIVCKSHGTLRFKRCGDTGSSLINCR